MRVRLHVGGRATIWLQGQGAPLHTRVVELDDNGFPTVVDVTDSRPHAQHLNGRRLKRSRVRWSVLVGEDMVEPTRAG